MVCPAFKYAYIRTSLAMVGTEDGSSNVCIFVVSIFTLPICVSGMEIHAPDEVCAISSLATNFSPTVNMLYHKH